jgi:site-specific DNA-methyltransferase (adenine-specific)
MEINKIYNENCLDTMARMPDNFIDLTVTSPPYDNLRNYKGYCFEFESIAKELFRVTKQGGVVVWVVGDATVNGSETGTSFKQALYFMQCGFNLHDTMIYAKENPIPLTHNRYEQAFEYMFVLSKDKPKTFNPLKEKCITNGSYNHRRNTGRVAESATRNRDEKTYVKADKFRINMWYYTVGNNEDTTQHPAPYPEQLAAEHIYSWSNENDLVYDPFGGSGTTAKMAHIQKRKWILSEMSKEYCEIAEKRLKPYLQQTTLF